MTGATEEGSRPVLATVALFAVPAALLVGLAVRGGPADPRFHGWLLLGAVLVTALALLLLPGRAPGRWPVLAAAVLTLAGLAVVVQRGVTWPWTPTAGRAQSACVVLEAAGLDRHWPAASRRKVRDEPDRTPGARVERTRCEWFQQDVGPTPAPFLSVTAAVGRYGGTATMSPANDAYTRFDTGRAAHPVRRDLTGVGDEAFAASFGDGIVVWARRANVIVDVGVMPVADGTVSEAVVRDLAAAMLATVSDS